MRSRYRTKSVDRAKVCRWRSSRRRRLEGIALRYRIECILDALNADILPRESMHEIADEIHTGHPVSDAVVETNNQNSGIRLMQQNGARQRRNRRIKPLAKLSFNFARPIAEASVLNPKRDWRIGMRVELGLAVFILAD
jgi:hypothetical protein